MGATWTRSDRDTSHVPSGLDCRAAGNAIDFRQMKLLVIGGGGREHALVWKLAQSPRVSKLWCAPGNAGTQGEPLATGGTVENVALSAEDLGSLLAFAREHHPDLTVVGPDGALALGLVDAFQAEGYPIWGPRKAAARFEFSKAFSQEFMRRHGIPTAQSGTFTDPASALHFARQLGGRCVVKADGLALGKGVIMARDLSEAAAAIDRMLVDRMFGEASREVVIQEWLEGTEISLHALCDGSHFQILPSSQDHKRVGDGDLGPNTGGMGTYSPTPFLSTVEWEKMAHEVLDPWLVGCRSEGIDFRGLIYPGVMLTAHGPRVLEFNARWGDPETQVYLPRLENDLVEIFLACIDGTLHRHPLRWSPLNSVCVVLASHGYPGAVERGKVIHGLADVALFPQVKVFHAGTARLDEEVVTSGGRVLGVTAWDTSLHAARDRAYAAVDHLCFEGMQFRRDIAAKGLAVAPLV